ncbi:UNVERIFIED_CONTAM: hypothetical protein RMT77_011016 [Armadillidium vulgare]
MSNDSYVKDILPPKPEAPLPSDCCGTGCSPCVYDIYEEDLKKWKKSCEQLKLDDSPKDQQAIISTNKFTSVKLTGVTQITNNSFIYQFELPEKTCLGLQIGHHIVIKGILDNKVVLRPYTPINEINSTGMFELMIKLYPKGKMSTIISKLSIGDQIEIRGSYGSFKYQPNSFKRLVFLAAGTGIAPMFQIIQQILKDEEDMTRLHLMYSSKSFKDILLREELYKFQSYWNFTVFHYLSEEKDSKNKKYSENVVLRRLTKQDVKEELLKMFTEETLVLISGTKSFDKDMVNAALDVFDDDKNIHRF